MKRSRYILAFVFLLLFTLPGRGADHRFVHLSFTNVPGSNGVFSIGQDGDGHMWFYTQGGIDRFDGDQIRHYAIPDSGITPNFIPPSNLLKTDRDGRMRLILTSGYGLCYDLKTDSFFNEYDFSRLLVDDGRLYDTDMDDSGKYGLARPTAQ